MNQANVYDHSSFWCTVSWVRKTLFSHFQVAFLKEPQIPARKIQTLEEMLHELKLYWLEKSTYTRVVTEPTYNAATLSPVIAPSLRSHEVVNTEAEKKSVGLSSQVDGEQNNHLTIKPSFRNKVQQAFPYERRALSAFCPRKNWG